MFKKMGMIQSPEWRQGDFAIWGDVRFEMKIKIRSVGNLRKCNVSGNWNKIIFKLK